MAIRRASLIINCGYARVCIYQNSNPSRNGRNARQNIDNIERSDKFRFLFSTHPTYGIPDSYFTTTGNNRHSQFDRDCSKILDGFQSKFRTETGLSRESYLQEFSFLKWSELPTSEKTQHTLSNCIRCFELHKEHQCSFPLKPVYHPDPVIVVDQETLQRQGVKAFTTKVLSELNRVYTNETSSSFTDALLQDKSLQLQRKKQAVKKGRKKESCTERSLRRSQSVFLRMQQSPC